MGELFLFHGIAIPISISMFTFLNLVKMQIPLGECMICYSSFVENCLSTIGVYVFQCVNFDWRTFLFFIIFFALEVFALWNHLLLRL